MYNNLLIPLDVSKADEKVNEEIIEAAAGLAKTHNAKITLIHVAEIFALLPKERKSEFKYIKDRTEQYIKPLKEKIEAHGVPVSLVVIAGDPASEICSYARRGDFDLIILYSRGFGWIVGSVFADIMKNATKPVLALRPAMPSLLADKSVLVVDDEPDILEVVEEHLDMCKVQKAMDYETALQSIQSGSFDIVILDIMGVNGIELLKASVSKGFPTVMLTAHALTPEKLKESVKLGAAAFLPKEKILELEAFLEDVIEREGKPVWKKLFDQLGSYFRTRFGWSDTEEDGFYEEIAEDLK